jgi:sec-independent protein translocase protein TatB
VFGIGLPEVAVILVVAVIVFGPDRLPEFGRQAGRFVRQVRNFARSTQDELRRELGPEYADLKLSDLDPRQAIRRHILDALEEDEDPIQDTRNATRVLGAGELPPYDVEAT